MLLDDKSTECKTSSGAIDSLRQAANTKRDAATAVIELASAMPTTPHSDWADLRALFLGA
jgi:hypothetical protein